MTKSLFKGYFEFKGLESFYGALNRVEPIIYVNRQRRFTNMGTVNVLRELCQRKPIVDNSVFELLMAIPNQYRESNKLYAAWVRRKFPDFFRDIPWQKTGKVVGEIKTRSIPERAIAKAIRTARSIWGISDKKNYTEYPAWIREASVSSYLSDLLKPEESVYSDYAAEDWYQEYLRPHLSNTAHDKSDMVLRAATVEIYLRKVFGKPTP
ncbi:hypothetical protein [Chlorobium sp. N1]|uniref:hypothetical protein n=1 Tax=Chlorobium sp. N1 TaxID=2491138 RepID=UPI00103F1FB7|nr:hypothetical protein [Chlorobium sp. N1]TCD46811.1 hypothetical protein E0L29_11355 [Chlorobium sp. N1]